MTNEQEEALDKLLNYVLGDEARDYRDSVEEPDQHHIYHAIYALAKMRGWNVDSPEELWRKEHS